MNLKKLHLRELKNKEKTDMHLDLENDQMKEMLSELHEEVDLEDLSLVDNGGELSFEGSIEKNQNASYGEYVSLEGMLKAHFVTYCTLSGKPMADTIEASVFAAFIDETNQEKFHFDDEEISLVLNGKDYDLYYYRSNVVDIFKALHEALFLNKNPYPKLG